MTSATSCERSMTAATSGGAEGFSPCICGNVRPRLFALRAEFGARARHGS
jgi:hypothetical protein